MKTLRARVVNGQLVPECPSHLQEGMVVDLAIIDEGDDLDDEERAALHAAISQSVASLDAGAGISAEDVLGELDHLG